MTPPQSDPIDLLAALEASLEALKTVGRPRGEVAEDADGDEAPK